jgi:hypothetical protein
MFCADCSKSTLFNGHFLCTRFYKTETNLVTGETKTRGALTSCDYERSARSTRTCGPEGKFFEGKSNV